MSHSYTNFGGTRSCKTNTIACLVGIGAITTGAILDKKSITSSKQFKGADDTIILKCSTKDNITALKNNKSFALGPILCSSAFCEKTWHWNWNPMMCLK